MNCKDCEHFEVICYPLVDKYDAGRAKCKKYGLVTDFFGKRKLNNLKCVDEESEKE